MRRGFALAMATQAAVTPDWAVITQGRSGRMLATAPAPRWGLSR